MYIYLVLNEYSMFFKESAEEKSQVLNEVLLIILTILIGVSDLSGQW